MIMHEILVRFLEVVLNIAELGGFLTPNDQVHSKRRNVLYDVFGDRQ